MLFSSGKESNLYVHKHTHTHTTHAIKFYSTGTASACTSAKHLSSYFCLFHGSGLTSCSQPFCGAEKGTNYRPNEEGLFFFPRRPSPLRREMQLPAFNSLLLSPQSTKESRGERDRKKRLFVSISRGQMRNTSFSGAEGGKNQSKETF